MTVWNDGGGDDLYVAGVLSAADDVGSPGLARWDGSEWSAVAGDTQGGVGIAGYPLALAVWDDGGGEALYAGGAFDTAGGVTVNNIARWDGSEWSPLESVSGPGLPSAVWALAVWDDGGGPALYVAGTFTDVGGLAVGHIAKWDGAAWSSLAGPSATGVNSAITSLAVWDDGGGTDLYAGGFFFTAGGLVAKRVARWDGTAWSTLTGPTGTGLDDHVYALADFDDGGGSALYVGGLFDFAGTVPAPGIARWDGTAWSALDAFGTAGRVDALTVWDDGGGAALYAGGEFTTIGGVTVNGIARWDGSTWSAVPGPEGVGASGEVLALSAFDDGGGEKLYAGGAFQQAGGVAAHNIAGWDAATWSSLTAVAGAGVGSRVDALAVFDDGSGEAVFAGGQLVVAGDAVVNHLGRWDGGAWSALEGPAGTGVNSLVSVAVAWDDGGGEALFVGGEFVSAGGQTVRRVAKWDGAQWSALADGGGIGVDGPVLALAVWDDGGGPALFAGGDFTTAGGVTANHVARWDGSTWSVLAGPSGTGTSGPVHALAVWDDGGGSALYATGLFETAGGVTVESVAKWNGTAWSALSGPLGTGFSGPPTARGVTFAVWDDGGGSALYAGGYFTEAGGVQVNRTAKWDGAEWSALPGAGGVGTNGVVHGLTVWDDGDALYAGGEFTKAGGGGADHLAKWDGTTWSALAAPGLGGTDGNVRSLAGWGDALYVGGRFDRAGEVPSQNIAKWVCADIFSDGFESGDTLAWSASTP